MAARGIRARDRFSILSRDNFECQFCGSRPGNDRPHVDHIIPWSYGGSDDFENLCTACDRCNLGKRDRISVPRKFLSGPVIDGSGWLTWKVFGTWQIEVCEGTANIVCPTKNHYWISVEEAWKLDWESHVFKKRWGWEFEYDLALALDFSRRVMRNFYGRAPRTA